MTQQPAIDQNQQRARARARRTALTLGLIAVVIYVAFILKGVLGK
jgi:hypothetical protein